MATTKKKSAKKRTTRMSKNLFNNLNKYSKQSERVGYLDALLDVTQLINKANHGYSGKELREFISRGMGFATKNPNRVVERFKLFVKMR